MGIVANLGLYGSIIFFSGKAYYYFKISGGIKGTNETRKQEYLYDESGKIINSKTYEVNVQDLSSGSAVNGGYKTFMIYPGDQIFVKERLV